MGLIDDPVSGVLGVFFKHAMDSKIAQRATLLLEMGIAGTIAFLVATGASLLFKPVPIAIGTGMLAAGIALFATFQVSPNSKGLVISLPSQAAQEEMETPTTTIARK